ncbi:uncharacterized protein LOC130495698 [Raphanus sativus]|uniref:Uncharacterized protein LOC130495698 n=1 Tax=Raphanus sativus TaxID=3726 RepID=A0A9W3BV30_RAPSA|nr:uncharacterized protein LOC130495698 [Raphanus sativus]
MTGNYNNYTNFRDRMYKRIDEETENFSREFVAGVEEFMTFANSQELMQNNGGKFFCPCSICKNEKFLPGQKILRHIYSRGFMEDYYVWYNHGKEIDMRLGTSYVDPTHLSGSGEGGNLVQDRYVEMVNDAFCDNVTYDNYQHDDNYQNVVDPVSNHSQKFYDLLEGAKNPLYDGCHEGHSQLSLAARVLQNKTDYNMSEKCVDSVCQMLTDYLPAGNQSTASHYETERLMRNLGIPYYTIDVCVNNCMIFWKEDEKWDECQFCDAPRWKPRNERRRTKVAYSRMWYLPIADRLKRMYQSKKTASAMRWHAEHQAKEGEMCHPSDAAEWKNFQDLHPRFAEEPRNVYLGLCTDGFNPFGMSNNHSLWPVILTPYNLPPGMCMNTEYLFLTILNSGPNHPRASLDIFLKPLIAELKDLWSTRVEAYDVSLNQNFNLKAVLLWTISDFPAYGMLSGWTTHGKLSCPICMEDIKAFYLPNGRKTCWFDCHRTFLPHDHPLRKNKRDFVKGKHAVNDFPPESLTGEQVYSERLSDVSPPKTSKCGGNGHDKKKPGYGKTHNWHKESIFWELPYWRDLTLRHNIDVMHIEKNFFDNIINTLMNVKGKSKDTIKSRLDIVFFCDREHLHVDSNGKAPFPPYTLDKTARTSLLECVKHSIKFPDGYASDLAKWVDHENGKFSGMKSHDCHVFMERLLPFIFANLLVQNVHLALSGVGLFFRDLCSRTLQKSRLNKLKENIVLIICNLEKIFPPSFFDVMQHLPIHLPYEAELGGPVQYKWMFTRFDEGQVPVYHVEGVPDIFTHIGRPSGEMQELRLSEKDYRCAHSYVLRNCNYFQPFERMFGDYISAKYPDISENELSARRADEYHIWVKDYKHGEGRKTCNYGVCVKGESYTNVTDEAHYYGILTDIIQIEYEGAVDLRITLFKCKWYDPVLGRGTRRSNAGIIDVLSSRKYDKYDPFILASQAEQVCYIPYPYVKKPKKLWLNVLKVNPRRLIIPGEYEDVASVTLQQENYDAVSLTTIENLEFEHLAHDREEPINLDFEVADGEPNDEFQCNLSSPDDDEEE